VLQLFNKDQRIMPSRHDAEAQFKAASTLAPMLGGSAVMLVARLKVNHARDNARLSSIMPGSLPTAALVSSTALSMLANASADRSGSGMHAGFSTMASCSLGGSPVCFVSTAGHSFCITRFLAKKEGLTPSRISVPRPAMFVAIGMAKARPACATISLSRPARSASALST